MFDKLIKKALRHIVTKQVSHSMLGETVLHIETGTSRRVLRNIGVIEEVKNQREYFGNEADSIIVAKCHVLNFNNDGKKDYFYAPICDLTKTETGRGYEWIK